MSDRRRTPYVRFEKYLTARATFLSEAYLRIRPLCYRFWLRRSTLIASLLLALCVELPAQTLPVPTNGDRANLPLMPWPSEVQLQTGELPIQQTFTVGLQGAGASDPRVVESVRRFLYRMFRETGIPVGQTLASPASNPTLIIEVQHAKPGIQNLGDDESYSLTVTPTKATLVAKEPLGAIRGLETLLQLVRSGRGADFSVPAVEITDRPRFPWRGLSLDVARHFLTVDDLKRTLDGISAVKMNVFHLHLTDDQGFRVESKIFPKLQQMGSDGNYYTQDEIKEIVAYGRARGVRVVPEIEMPGHSTSWYPGYPTLATGNGPYDVIRRWGIFPATMDPTRESTYKFLDRLIGEFAGLFPDEYFHIGGDEVDQKGEWASDDNPKIAAFMKGHNLADLNALQAYFNRRVLAILTKHGKHMEGWDEILHPDLPKTIVIQSWRGQESLVQAARGGYRGILSTGYYLDLMQPASEHYLVDPLKGATENLTPEEQERILGGEAAMWEELATTENIDVKLWPRTAAIAERFWSKGDVVDVPWMYQRLTSTSRWLALQGLQHEAQLRLMQLRLAGEHPLEPLSRFATALDPVKGYARTHQGGKEYSILSAYNSLVDAIPPESDVAREFRDTVSRLVSSSNATPADIESVRRSFTGWKQSAAEVQEIFQDSPLLGDYRDVAKSVDAICQIGLDALDRRVQNKPMNAAWMESSLADLDRESKPRGAVLIQIAPGVRMLIEGAKAASVPLANPQMQ